MATKKILGVIFGLIFIGAFAFVLTWGILNWQQVKDGMSGSGLYTQEDLNNAYDDGYNSALTDKSEYDELVKSYRDEITRLIDENSKANSDYNDLQKQNKSLQSSISSLENDKLSLNEQIDAYKAQVQTLNATIDENNKKISNLENQISQKEREITSLKSSGANKDNEISNLNGQITSLNSQIASLRTVNSQLESTNQANLTTITNLNAQIVSLNAQIVALQNQYQGNQDIINSLNAKIKQLEKSIEYYEQFIANLESGEKVVATFEFNGVVCNIQILQKGGKVLFPTPDSTDYCVFNYWETESGEKVQDVSSYTISENTKFVANVTLKFDVKFSVDGTVRESQIVENGQAPSLPSETPVKVGYDFDGWTLNGIDIVDPTQQSITQHTTFVAKFTQKFTVTFMYESEIKSTQEVRSGGHAQNVEIENTTYKRFNGWKVNGEIVDVEDYEIVGATTFIADITYFYDVTFKYEQETKSTQVVEYGKYAQNVEIENTQYKKFNGWKVNGVIVDVSSYAITSPTTFYADITYSYDVKFFVDDNQYGQTQIVENGNVASVPDVPTKDGYVFQFWTLNGVDQIDVSNYLITKNTDFIAYFSEIINFSDLSWTRISEISKEISSKNMTSQQVYEIYGWKIGDKKTFSLTSGEEITICILGFNHDDKSDGSGKAGISLGMTNVLLPFESMDNSKKNNIYDTSVMRTETLKDVFSRLPEELQDIIVEVDKKCFNPSSLYEIKTSNDKLWFLSVSEIFSESCIKKTSSVLITETGYRGCFLEEGKQYEFYKDKIGDGELSSTAYYCLKKDYSWWLRTSRPQSQYYFSILGSGTMTGITTSTSTNVAISFCFCI